jgi:hypothetical protein
VADPETPARQANDGAREPSSSSLPTGAVVNPTRERRFRMGSLKMNCTEREVPYEDSREAPTGTWIAAGAFAGDAAPLEPATGNLEEPSQHSCSGATAVTIVGGRLLAIVAPTGSEPAVWLAVPTTALKLETRGEQGLFHKRPQMITITTEHWDLHLREVMQLTRPMSPATLERSTSMQPRKETSLVAALS